MSLPAAAAPPRAGFLAPLLGAPTLLLLALAADGASAQGPADAALRRAADELLPRAEALSGLEARGPVHVARRSREELRAIIDADSASEGAREERALGHVYRRLGLLPGATDVEELSSDFLVEQVAGYYDPKRDTLYVLDDLPVRSVRAVLLHEIVHALQDQHVSLDSLMARGRGGDRRLAARAVVEGQAMLAMFLFAAEEELGRPLRPDEMPDLTHVSLDLVLPFHENPVFSTAPRVVREGFLFPYLRGAGFVHALRRHGRTEASPLALLPASTEQVMDPEGRFLGERDDPTEVIVDGLPPAADADSAGGAPGRWRTVHENTLGQFELSLLLQERDPRVGAEEFARGWDGDRYALLTDGERHAVLWYVLWDDRVSAYHFAQTYRQLSHLRLGRSVEVEEVTVDGRPVVRVVDADEGVDLASLPRPSLRLAPERD